MTTTLHEFRCTRPDCYPARSPGHADPSARQGHYVDAATEAEARAIMRAHYPHDLRIDVQLHKRNVGTRDQ